MHLIVNIDVEHIEQAIAFYESGLGLQLTRRLFDGAVAEMTGTSCPIYLIEQPAMSDAVPGTGIHRQYQRHWTPVHLDFAVDDINEAVDKAVSTGAAQEGETQHFDWGKLATMSDPFGNGFCLLEFSEHDYDHAE